jgi:type IV secretory pathway VirJ component
MVDTVLVSMNSQLTAVEAAQISMLNPTILPVADALLHEAGFVSKSEEEAQQVQAQAQQDQAAQQQQMQQQQMQEQQMQQQQQEQAQQQQQGPAQDMQQGIPLPGGPQ